MKLTERCCLSMDYHAGGHQVELSLYSSRAYDWVYWGCWEESLWELTSSYRLGLHPDGAVDHAADVDREYSVWMKLMQAGRTENPRRVRCARDVNEWLVR